MLPNIMEYLDYQSFLKDWMESVRKKKKFMSFRYLAGKTEMDVGTLAKVFNGQRHLTRKQAILFPKILNLNAAQAEFFITLVAYCRANNGDDIRLYFEKLMAIKGVELPSLSHSQTEFYHTWYHSVIRAALSYITPKEDFSVLANSLVPPISITEAKESVELLLRLGLVEKNNEGAYEATQAFVTGGGYWNTQAIRNFQQQVIRLGERSLLHDSPENRDISTLTVSIPSKALPEIKSQISEFRKLLLRRIMDMEDPNCVYQLNIQFIPVTKIGGQNEI
jgi:uncharacterized protein (TIGR02147 family)